jgi:hypothetical protein
MKKTKRTNIRKKSISLRNKSLRKRTMKHKYRRNGGMRSILGATSNIARVTARVTGDIAENILKDQLQKIPSGKDVLSTSKKHQTIHDANYKKLPEYYRTKYSSRNINTDSDSENIHPNIQYSTRNTNTTSDSENVNPNIKRQTSQTQIQVLKPKTPRDTNI